MTCNNQCGTTRKITADQDKQVGITVCDLPARLRQLRLVSEADRLTLDDMASIDDGVILDVDYLIK